MACITENTDGLRPLLPTEPNIYSMAEMLVEPIRANAKLGPHAKFVNFLHLAAIALPARFGPDGTPFGNSLIGPAFSKAALAALADALNRGLGVGSGKSMALARTDLASTR